MDGLIWFLIILALSVLLAICVAGILIAYILQKRKKNKVHINQVAVANSCTDTSSQDSSDVEHGKGKHNNKSKTKSSSQVHVFHGLASNTKGQKLFEAPPPPPLSMSPDLELEDMPLSTIAGDNYKLNLSQFSPGIKSNQSISLTSSRRSIGKRNTDNSIVVVVNDVPHYNPNMPFGIELGGFSKLESNGEIDDSRLPTPMGRIGASGRGSNRSKNRQNNIHVPDHHYIKNIRRGSNQSVMSFSKRVAHLLENNSERLYDEFQALEKQHPKHATAFFSQQSSRRNRFYDSVPFEFNRVVLKYGGGDDYINASYINNLEGERSYISTQGPIGSDECFNGRRESTISDFWRLIYQEDIDCVVMLTQLTEGLRTKCSRYWPENPDETIYLDYGLSVKFYCLIEDENSFQREFLLFDGSSDPPKKVLQWQFKKWNDGCNPQDNLSLLHFIRQVRISPHIRPILVHCSAGIGRTGVYIAIEQLLDHLEQNQEIDVFGVVHSLRQQRPSIIQNIEQYRTIYDVISMAVRQKLGQVERDDLTSLDRNKWLSNNSVSST